MDRMMLAMVSGIAVFAAESAVADVTNEELAKLVAADVAKPVRPVGVGGQTEYWNVNATWFMYPPAFAFPEKRGADGYRVRIVDANGRVRCFEQTNSVVSLEKHWMELPAGRTEVWCDAYSKWSHWTVDRHFRNFWKMAPYAPGSYPKAPRSYAEAATKCCEYLLEMPWLKTYAETGKPDPTYKLNCYPTKMDAAMVELMVDYARVAPARKAKALALARTMADHLISISQPKDAPLANFPPTYLGKNYTSKQYNGMNMLDYPAQAGAAYLKLSAATGEAKYLETAKGIAETYLKLQGEDGTWYLKMYEKDGRPVAENRLHPGSVIAMMDELFKVTGDVRYRRSADRALGFYERGPLRDWNWEGQFEDVEPSGKYENLTKHPACELAQTLLARGTKDAKCLARARELLRFAEDQFVVWQRPKGDDAGSVLALMWDGWDVEPAVVEQYFYREAVDGSAAKLINTYLALYRASGNPLDLAKARTLGDSIVRIQRPNGRIPTIWSLKFVEDLQSDWVNCMAASVQALVNLAAAVPETASASSLHPIFRDGMVLAANKPIRVYGAGRDPVRVTFRGEMRTAERRADGWCVTFPPAKPAGGETLTVDLGTTTNVLKDVRVGEVFLMAGQSNQGVTFRDSTNDRTGWSDEPRLRCYTLPSLEELPFSPRDGWVPFTVRKAPDWAALLTLFGRERLSAGAVAYGAVGCYQGASVIESWLPASVAQKPGFRLPKENLHVDHFMKEYSRWNSPGKLYDEVFRKIGPFSFSGVVWYQGESNTGPGEAAVYPKWLKELVTTWRRDLEDPDLPFVVVQIADLDWRNDADWHALQAAQAAAADALENVVAVRSADVCESANIHPRDKSALARRLSRAWDGIGLKNTERKR